MKITVDIVESMIEEQKKFFSQELRKILNFEKSNY